MEEEGTAQSLLENKLNPQKIKWAAVRDGVNNMQNFQNEGENMKVSDTLNYLGRKKY